LNSNACESRLEALRRRDYPNPQVSGQVWAKLGRYREATDAFRRCTTPLGIARYGELLLSGNRGEGEKLLSAATKQGCGFAEFVLGRIKLEAYNASRPNRASEADLAIKHSQRSALFGLPDAAYMAGIITGRRNKFNVMKEIFQENKNY
jgi:hypothetical protein